MGRGKLLGEIASLALLISLLASLKTHIWHKQISHGLQGLREEDTTFCMMKGQLAKGSTCSSPNSSSFYQTPTT